MTSLLHDWRFWARPSQLPPPGDWRVWLICAGRGYGKTRAGAEWVRAQAESGACRRLALVAPTAADARNVMVEGESGLLAIAPRAQRPRYEPSKRRLTWPNGAIATTYSADEPDRLRGPQHDGAWCDELAAWRAPQAWDMLRLGLRLGADPRAVVTTTPRPVPHLKALLAESHLVVTRGSTYENAANLAPAFLAKVIASYEGTSLGRQELYAELLDESEGALWTRDVLNRTRVVCPPEFQRIVVAIDPAASHNTHSSETGIIVAALGEDGDGYVLEDLSCKASSNAWAMMAVSAYHKYRADRIVAEANNGGEMVEEMLYQVDPMVSYLAVHASHGKTTRAEPVAALYERGRIHHVGIFPTLEAQLCTRLTPHGGADRLDALVWALTELMRHASRPSPLVML